MLSSPAHRTAAGALLVVAAVFSTRRADAQELALKRAAVRPRPGACVQLAPPRQPAGDQRDEARQRATLAQEAAIVGNQRAARDQFARAAQLDPTSEEIAYQYGRALEDAGTPTEALREYCRYLSLAPTGSDAADVRARVAALTPAAPAASSVDPAAPQFRAGLAAYDRADYAGAVRGFSTALLEAPSWADAYYNRGLAYLGIRDETRAAADLRRYLELKPDASDGVTVLNRLQLIERPAPFTPSGALARGLIPGLGQVYTRRPVLGVGVLAAFVGGATVAAQQRRTVRDVVIDTFFINIANQRVPYKDTITVKEITYPNRALGAAIAGGVTAAAALEAFYYARRVRAAALSGRARRSASYRVLPLPAADPRATGVALNVSVALPRRR
jgi:tetratricopeptide (TPR) repeat protein